MQRGAVCEARGGRDTGAVSSGIKELRKYVRDNIATNGMKRLKRLPYE